MPGTRASPACFRRPVRERGAVLIVTLLVMALLALALGSYLTLNLTTSRLARRDYQQTAAFHLAEAGAEEALWSFNQANANSPGAWSGWSGSSPAAWRKFSGFDFGGNATGSVKVYVSNNSPAGGAKPTVVAMASVESPGMPANTRMLQVTLSRRSYFANGLVARDSITFAGSRASVDSWNSDPDNDPATPPVDYSAATRHDGGSIATLSLNNTAMLINQANIWGSASTGGAAPQVGVNGTIRGADTPAGVLVDPARVFTDFTADLPAVTAPTDGTVIATVGATLGTPGQATRWRCPGIVLHASQTLTILGDVTLILTGTSSSVLDVTGNASIIVPAGSTLQIYAEGDIKIAGNGMSNANTRPISCLIWGTNATSYGQSIQIAGNGALKTVIYAPNADIKINGNGNVMGAVVGEAITLTGNADFHYDESLASYGADASFGVTRWHELTTAAERATWLGVFNGW